MERQLKHKMTVKKFIMVVDGDVAGGFVIPGNERFTPFQDALINGVNIMEVPVETNVYIGMQYDGEKFYDPSLRDK